MNSDLINKKSIPAIIIISSLLVIVFVIERAYVRAIEWPESSDFYKFYLSGKRLINGESMYWLSPGWEVGADFCRLIGPIEERYFHAHSVWLASRYGEFNDCLHPNLNPPFSAVLFFPLATLEFSESLVVWIVISLFSAIYSIYLVFSVLNYRLVFGRLVSVSVGVFLFFSFFPTWVNFDYGQVTTIVMLLLTLGWRAMRRENYWASGFWIGVAVSFKPFFGVFLIILCYIRAWSVVRSMILTCSAALLVGLYVAGISSYFDYFQIARGVTWVSVNWNASGPGFFSRIFGGPESVLMLDFSVLSGFLNFIFSFMILWPIFKYFSCKKAGVLSHREADVLFSLAIPAILLISPLGWIYYIPLLLFSLVLWVTYINFGSSGRVSFLLLVGVLAIFQVPTVILPVGYMREYSDALVEGSRYFYLLILFYFILCFSVNRNFISPRLPEAQMMAD